MVEYHEDDDERRLVLYPNRSMSWQTNKKILIALFCVNMVIALSWTAMGAWMILPFAGLEVFFVGLGMYYVSWKLSFRQIITINAESLILQKGIYFPKNEWRWHYDNTYLIKQPSKYRMSAPSLYLKNVGEKVEIGDFLNLADKKILRQHLLDLGLPLRIIDAK